MQVSSKDVAVLRGEVVAREQGPPAMVIGFGGGIDRLDGGQEEIIADCTTRVVMPLE